MAYEDLIRQYAAKYGLDPNVLRRFVQIESGGRAKAQTGSYQGLLQLSQPEFAKYGGGNDINDPAQNLDAGAAKLAAESKWFFDRYGRQPTADQLYMMHQQGQGGYAAHVGNPNAPAWENMYSTAEGQQKGEDWAKRAIWGNVPDSEKAKYGSVDNMTSQQFMDMWANRINGGGGASDQSTQTEPKEEKPPVGSLFSMLAGMGAPMGGVGAGVSGLAGSGLDSLFGGGGGAGSGSASGADTASASANPLAGFFSGLGGGQAPAGGGADTVGNINPFGSLGMLGQALGGSGGGAQGTGNLAQAEAARRASAVQPAQLQMGARPQFNVAQLQQMLQQLGKLGTTQPRVGLMAGQPQQS